MADVRMADIECAIPVPSTLQDLEKAIQIYKASNLTGNELFCYWQAIRKAALELSVPEPEGDRIPGEESY